MRRKYTFERESGAIETLTFRVTEVRVVEEIFCVTWTELRL